MGYEKLNEATTLLLNVYDGQHNDMCAIIDAEMSGDLDTIETYLNKVIDKCNEFKS